MNDHIELKDGMKFEEVNFETGDIILFVPEEKYNTCKRCFFSLLSCCIQFWEHSPYSHVGMIVKDPNFGPEELKGIYLIESTGLENVKDVENKEIKFGVQLRSFQEVFKDYEGKVFWRKLTNIDRNEEFYRRLKIAHSIVHNRPYDCHILDWIGAMFNLRYIDIQNNKTFFALHYVLFF